jgi:hypothetical protein
MLLCFGIVIISYLWCNKIQLLCPDKRSRGRFFQSLRLVKAAEPSAPDHFWVVKFGGYIICLYLCPNKPRRWVREWIAQWIIEEVVGSGKWSVTMFATGKVTTERWTCAREGFVLLTTTNLSATLREPSLPSERWKGFAVERIKLKEKVGTITIRFSDPVITWSRRKDFSWVRALKQAILRQVFE